MQDTWALVTSDGSAYRVESSDRRVNGFYSGDGREVKRTLRRNDYERTSPRTGVRR